VGDPSSWRVCDCSVASGRVGGSVEGIVSLVDPSGNGSVVKSRCISEWCVRQMWQMSC
jgi:hypothetical protein